LLILSRYGGGVALRLKDNGIESTSLNGATESTEKTNIQLYSIHRCAYHE
jgi:hypothetical protein